MRFRSTRVKSDGIVGHRCVAPASRGRVTTRQQLPGRTFPVAAARRGRRQPRRRARPGGGLDQRGSESAPPANRRSQERRSHGTARTRPRPRPRHKRWVPGGRRPARAFSVGWPSRELTRRDGRGRYARPADIRRARRPKPLPHPPFRFPTTVKPALAADAVAVRGSPRLSIVTPLFDDASLKGAPGVLTSITGGKNLTLYEVDEAASRIVGAIIDPALKQAIRVSVVATGIDQSANCRMSAQSFAEPVLPPNVAPASLEQTAGTPVRTVESRPPIAGSIEFETPPLPAPVIPFPEPTGRRQTLDEETHFDPPAIRRLLERFAVTASERRQGGSASCQMILRTSSSKPSMRRSSASWASSSDGTVMAFSALISSRASRRSGSRKRSTANRVAQDSILARAS
jgi:FtsZ family, C-terminal domain